MEGSATGGTEVYPPPEGTGDHGEDEPLVPMDESGLPEYAFGHRLLGAYEVPTDGLDHPLDLDTSRASFATWVTDCLKQVDSDNGGLEVEIGTGTVLGATGALRCVGEDGWITGWLSALLPGDLVSAEGGAIYDPHLAMRSTTDPQTQVAAAYEPVPFEEFPFDEAVALFESESGPGAEPDPALLGAPLGSVNKETARVTLADLDTEGSATIELTPSQLTRLFVSTEGVGRFWLEPDDLDDGPMTSTGPAGDTFGRILGRDGYWTSWTDQPARWPMAPITDSGCAVDRLTVRVEGYEGGSFELRVIGQFPEDEQP